MRIPKKYGSYRVDRCPFCNKQATASNGQGIPVCSKHTDKELLDLKCQCGDYLDLMNGKYGPYFKCMRCGNISFLRGIELNKDNLSQDTKGKFNNSDKTDNRKEKRTEKEKTAKETTVTSDMIDVYFS